MKPANRFNSLGPSIAGLLVAIALNSTMASADQGQTYTVPSTPADNSKIQQITGDASSLVSEGTYDGITPSGAACTVGVELLTGPSNPICLSTGDCQHIDIYQGTPRVYFSSPQITEGEGAAGPAFIPYYSFKSATNTSDGEMDLVIAQQVASSVRYLTLVEYKVTGKNGVPSSISGSSALIYLTRPIPGQTVSTVTQYPTCSQLVKRTP